MSFKVNVKTTIRINGQEYASVDEMPEDIRKQYEQIMMSMGRGSAVFPQSTVNIQQPEAYNSENPYERSDFPQLSVKHVYRKIWTYFLVGAFLLLLIIAYGWSLQHKHVHNSSLTWLLVLPIGFIIYSAYYSARHWRCPYCGHSLPTEHWSAKEHRCLHCGREIDF